MEKNKTGKYPKYAFDHILVFLNALIKLDAQTLSKALNEKNKLELYLVSGECVDCQVEEEI